ncbi:MAG: hypothetical protein KJP16_01845 [Gammaproteobacteria bacterium]|nr:hypothetical protein [Gammaproteobacteria bacterium]NNL49533.1 hypothetical protein [Woeseiaceae bacterium]
MNQQINLYQAQYHPRTRMFPALFMVQAAGILVFAMLLMYAFAQQRMGGVEQELEIVARQEVVATERLQNIGPLINAVTGETNWSEQLDDSLRMLAERQAVLNLIQGSTLGDTQGFSRHLHALARQDIDGLWLTHIVLSALGDKTRLEGRAIRAELVPLYVQGLAAEKPFATQRFHRFQIDSPVDDEEMALMFSMDSDVLLAADAGKVR